MAGCGRKPKPDDIVLGDPALAVSEARRMIAEKQADPGLYSNWINPQDLPASLRLAGLKCAIVHKDHVDLLIVRIPDWWAGARIWSANSTTRHADKPTLYQDVFFFTYSNDSPDSPENIR